MEENSVRLSNYVGKGEIEVGVVVAVVYSNECKGIPLNFFLVNTSKSIPAHSMLLVLINV